MTAFHYSITTAESGTVVTLTGGLDLHTAAELRPVLIRAADALGAGGELLLDLAGLDFIDSSGLSAFIAAHKRSAARGGRVRLVNAPDFVVRVLGVTGLDSIFPVGGHRR